MGIEPTQAEVIADRLGKLFHRAMTLRDAKTDTPLRVVHASELLQRPMRSRLERVDDAASGIDYAAWLIGETVAVIGGDPALHGVFAAFERAHGTRASSWLDHRWNGISASDGSWVS
ncbi:hypothetical protein FSB78_10000 [Sphingomonas ginsenosidivorax]|uniref:Uncharacterized protein n=1 Tax=Sphingomonas ginsenosidivorax TaxID=862135 RepID=A0A5C6UEQ5_9SPHN|nr:hypothetical protein [Sphingomonas ginsenosidivorax]TXC71242.1 hypothetical protein FSB78_10000 [Sphingomonas ginsenosidivorax]